MFTLLLENRGARRLGAQGLLSLFAHLGLGIGLVRAGTGGSQPPPRPVEVIPIGFSPPLRPAAPRPPRSHTPNARAPTPPPDAARVIVVPVEVPVGIPPVRVEEHPLDLWALALSRPSSIGCLADCAPAKKGSEILVEAELDQRAAVLHQPVPVYPGSLREAGLAGRVELEFVIDTTGRVEPGSVRVLQSTHRGFEVSALRVILETRFSPGKLRGRRVRQLTRQAMSFQLVQ